MYKEETTAEELFDVLNEANDIMKIKDNVQITNSPLEVLKIIELRRIAHALDMIDQQIDVQGDDIKCAINDVSNKIEDI